jgi:hypothetical protein
MMVYVVWTALYCREEKVTLQVCTLFLPYKQMGVKKHATIVVCTKQRSFVSTIAWRLSGRVASHFDISKDR